MSPAIRAAFALALVACGAPGAAAISNRVPAPPPEPEPEPEICPLYWGALVEVAPARIELAPIGSVLGDDCPSGFAPAAVLARCADCVTADLAPGRRGLLQLDGPNGSGRFASLGLVVDGPTPGFACAMASTVGWRHLYRVHDMIAPLPWLADAGDGDATAELIVWQRLPWGDAESDNALVPIVYELEGDALVRRDAHGVSLASRMAAAYRRLVELDPHGPVTCYRSAAWSLDRWGTPHRRRYRSR